MLIDNIGTLVTNDPELGTIADSALLFESDVVAWAGPRAQTPEGADGERFDAGGRAVIPGESRKQREKRERQEWEREKRERERR